MCAVMAHILEPNGYWALVPQHRVLPPSKLVCELTFLKTRTRGAKASEKSALATFSLLHGCSFAAKGLVFEVPVHPGKSNAPIGQPLRSERRQWLTD
jgi:hypothetical protein